MKKGKLIVIDGPDGCGKATQTERLVSRLRHIGFSAEKIDFPRYKDNFAGGLIGEFQCDAELDFANQNPYLCAFPYAIDRFESKPQLDAWLDAGTHVISDRYVSANQLHQGGKIKDAAKLKQFLERLDILEHKILNIPRPTITIYLDLPHDISIQFMKKKIFDEKKEYANGQMDLVEQDMAYQLGARESGMEMIKDPSWVKVQCSSDGKNSRSIEDIHEEILQHALAVLT